MYISTRFIPSVLYRTICLSGDTPGFIEGVKRIRSLFAFHKHTRRWRPWRPPQSTSGSRRFRKLVAEARQNGLIGVEDAASLSEVPNLRQKGTRLGNWLTREQAKEILAVPDRSTLKGKRDYVIMALLVGCALRRQELATLDVETIQLREGRCGIVFAGLRDGCGTGCSGR